MKAAIIYSHRATKTSQVAKLIKENTTIKVLEDIDVESLSTNILKNYNLLILGAPSWFDGELPHYWDELVPAIEDLNLKGVKVAIFGNADQEGYPENFGDAVGLLAEVFQAAEATIIGFTSAKGYNFFASKALINDKFMGLILDFENQTKMNNSRIKNWMQSIENQLN